MNNLQRAQIAYDYMSYDMHESPALCGCHYDNGMMTLLDGGEEFVDGVSGRVFQWIGCGECGREEKKYTGEIA